MENSLTILALKAAPKEKWLPQGFLISTRKRLKGLKKTKVFLLKRHNFLKEKEAAIKNNTPMPKELAPNVPIEDIKKIPIKQILQTTGISIYGKNFFKLRNERTPSCHFNEEKNLWYDFGSGQGGSVIDLYMRIYNTDNKEAIKELSTFV